MKAKDGKVGYEVIIKEKDKEYHFIVAEENRGHVVVLNILENVEREGDKKVFTAESYLLRENKVTKVVSGRYEIKGNALSNVLTSYEPEKIEIKKVK